MQIFSPTAIVETTPMKWIIELQDLLGLLHILAPEKVIKSVGEWSYINDGENNGVKIFKPAGLDHEEYVPLSQSSGYLALVARKQYLPSTTSMLIFQLANKIQHDFDATLVSATRQLVDGKIRTSMIFTISN